MYDYVKRSLLSLGLMPGVVQMNEHQTPTMRPIQPVKGSIKSINRPARNQGSSVWIRIYDGEESYKETYKET